MRLAVSFSLVAAVAVALACGPRYPSCDTDEGCKADGPLTTISGYLHKVCVDHKCVDCRDDAACGAGKECKAGTCAPKVGYCDEKTSCPGGAPCDKHQCGSPVAVSKPAVECDDDHPCRGAGDRCQNGHCVGADPGGPGCRDFPAPQFAYESADLTDDSKATLQRLATCIASGTLKGHKVLLTGHCDNRGEYEFNMSLGADRAERARTFLVGLGLTADVVTTSSRGKLDATGTDEDTWAKDRRVDVEVR